MSHPDWFDQSPQPDESGQGGPPPRQPRPVPAQPKRRGALGPTLAVLAVLFFLVTAMSGLVTDLWWFDSVGYRNVFVIQLVTKVLLFAVGFVLTALAVWSSISLGHRLRPFVVPTTVAQQTLEQYRRAIEPLRRLGTIIIPGILAVLAGAATLGSWPTYLLWRNGSDFGIKEPHFGIDVGFFVFDLPWWRFVVSFLTVVLMLALVAALLTLRLRKQCLVGHPRCDGPHRRPRGPLGAHAGGGLLAGPLLPHDRGFRPHHGPDLHP